MKTNFISTRSSSPRSAVERRRAQRAQRRGRVPASGVNPHVRSHVRRVRCEGLDAEGVACSSWLPAALSVPFGAVIVIPDRIEGRAITHKFSGNA